MDLSDAKKIVVIGGGQAGAQSIFSLRQWGYDGAITLIAGEKQLPYQRPPLSKAYMKGEMEEQRLYFRTADWYEDNKVDVQLSKWATGIDREAQTITLHEGDILDYDVLIIATGSRPRELPVEGADLENVFSLRSIADVDHIRPNMTAGKNLVIVGAGYIGLEAAAVARQLGLNVTVVEMAPRVLARVTSPTMSTFFADEHTRQGIDIHTEARLEKLSGADGAVSHAYTATGETLAADMVLVGIGIIPNEDIAKSAGVTCDNGICVDEDARTSDPRIFAVGDCAKRPLVHYGRNGRLESVHNAIEQGKLAAAAILGRDRPKEDCPWFWSDQYDLKLQIAGISAGYDDFVVRGAPESRKFAVYYLLEGRLISVDAINSPPDFMVGKKLIIAGAKLAPAQLSDTSISIKDIAKDALSG